MDQHAFSHTLYFTHELISVECIAEIYNITGKKQHYGLAHITSTPTCTKQGKHFTQNSLLA